MNKQPTWSVPWHKRPPITANQLDRLRAIRSLPKNQRKAAAKKFIEENKARLVRPVV